MRLESRVFRFTILTVRVILSARIKSDLTNLVRFIYLASSNVNAKVSPRVMR